MDGRQPAFGDEHEPAPETVFRRQALGLRASEEGVGPPRLLLAPSGAPVFFRLMVLDFATLSARDAYGWMVATILPRPIAWVSTVSVDGKSNLAPFSFFQGVTANPPTLMIAPVNTRHGGQKDTVRNLGQVAEFVVNLVPFRLAQPMNASSASLPYGESEFAACGIEPAPSVRVRPPRVAAAPVAFECVVDRVVPIGEGPLAANVVFGRIVLAHVADDVLGADGRPEPGKLDLIGRLGGDAYTRTTDRFSMVRPD